MSGLTVAVVGAGIGGLTLASYLRQAGLDCVVYERTAKPGTAGAGLQLSPNGSRLLRALGLGPHLDAVAVRPAAIEMLGWRDGTVLRRTELGAAGEKRYGAPYYTLHRSDLHAGLRALLRHTGDAVHTGRPAVRVESGAAEAAVHFADGSRETAHVVVGADGIRSVARRAFGVQPSRPAGLTVHRGLVPADRLPWSGPPVVRLWLGPGRHVVCYPVSAGRLVSFSALSASEAGESGSWTDPSTVDDVAGRFAGWDPRVGELFAAAGTVTRWTLHDHGGPLRLCTGRLALVGDAAHPLLPIGAQGANQAIEDAAGLAACLRTARPDSVAAALRRYQELRLPRLRRVIAAVATTTREHHRDDGQRSPRPGADEQDWLFGYDAALAASGRI